MADEEESGKAMAKEHSWPTQLLEPRLRGGQVCGRLGNLDQHVTGSGKRGWETLFSSLVCCPVSIFWRYFLVACPLLRSGSIIDLSSTANCSTPETYTWGESCRGPLCSEPSLPGSHTTARARGQAGKNRDPEGPSQHPAVRKPLVPPARLSF